MPQVLSSVSLLLSAASPSSPKANRLTPAPDPRLFLGCSPWSLLQFLLEVFSLGITLLVQVQIFGKLRGQPTSASTESSETSLQSPSSSGKAIAYEA